MNSLNSIKLFEKKIESNKMKIEELLRKIKQTNKSKEENKNRINHNKQCIKEMKEQFPKLQLNIKEINKEINKYKNEIYKFKKDIEELLEKITKNNRLKLEYTDNDFHRKIDEANNNMRNHINEYYKVIDKYEKEIIKLKGILESYKKRLIFFTT